MGRFVRRRVEPHFDSVWASRNAVHDLRAQARNRSKSLSRTLLKGVARQIACERHFFRVWRPQHGPPELSGAPWEPSRGPLGRSWGALGSLLGRSWALLERSWVAFGAPGSEFVGGLFCSMMLLSAKSRIWTIWERFLVGFWSHLVRVASDLHKNCVRLANFLQATCDRVASDSQTTCKVDELTTAIDITMHCWSIRGPPSTHGRF